MTPEQYKALLNSRRSSDRQIASRALAADPTLLEQAVIEAAYAKETVAKIRRDLTAALESRRSLAGAAAEPNEEQARSIYSSAYLQAMRDVTERILHQLNPLIGDIEQAAIIEIPKFAESATKTRIAQIRLQTEALTKLYNATTPAAFEEFDLATLVRDCIPHDLDHGKCSLRFAGASPFLVVGDPSLVTIAVTNGLRNAIEACLPRATNDQRPAITLNWNVTDRDYWISILDEGVGFEGLIEGAFQIGSTTKEGHSGHGLPAIRAALLSLLGEVEFIPQQGNGCRLTLTWPKIETG